jgi:hypothetical protein
VDFVEEEPMGPLAESVVEDAFLEDEFHVAFPEFEGHVVFQ